MIKNALKVLLTSIALLIAASYPAYPEDYKRKPSCETERVLKKHMKDYKVKFCHEIEKCNKAKKAYRKRTKGTRRGYTIRVGNQQWDRWRQDEEFEYDFE